MLPFRRRSVFSRRDVLQGIGATTAAGLLIPARSTWAAPPTIRAQQNEEVVHWVYSSLPLDKDTLTRVPPDKTDNVIEYFQWSVEEFKKVEPGINVKLEFMPHDETWFAKIDTSLVAGIPPDVVQGPVSEAAKYIPLGALSPVDEYMTAEEKADLVGAVTTEATFGDKSYLWPWRLSFGGGVQINATLWEQAGIADLLPSGETRRWSMDTALEAFKATTIDSNSDGSIDQYGTVLMTDIHYHVTQFLFGFGARLFNEDETAVILNSPEGVAGLQWLIDLEQTHKVAVPGSAVRKAAEADKIFIERKAASYPSQGAGVKPATLDGVEDFNWFWAPPPNVEGKDPAVMTNIHGHYVFQNESTDRTAAAHKWAHFLTRPDALALSLAQFGQPPARQSLWGAVTDENQKVGLRFTDIMVGFGRRASAAPITFTLVPRMLEAAFSGQKSPQQALDDLASEANKLIEDAIKEEQQG
jgi:multiple sugar transport system substrate-binding protein